MALKDVVMGLRQYVVIIIFQHSVVKPIKPYLVNLCSSNFRHGWLFLGLQILSWGDLIARFVLIMMGV